MAVKWYVFSTRILAMSAEADISRKMGCSVISRNAATGQPDPDACLTEKYAEVRLAAEGWVLPVPEQESLKLPPPEHGSVTFPPYTIV